MSVSRVALVSPYALSVYGGVQEQVLAMSRVLGARGVEVLIVAPDDRDHTVYDTPATVARAGPRLSIPANGSRAPLTISPSASLKARNVLRTFRPDVVHFHEPFAPLLGWAALKTHQFPAVGTFHRSGAGPALTLTKPLLRLLARDLDVAVAVSVAAASTIRDACALECAVLFNGVEMSRFVESPRIRDEVVTLFYVGRLEERKGVAVALAALRRHNEASTPPWRLVIAGDGPERARLRSLAAGDEHVVFLGAVDDAAKRHWLRGAHALIAPSLHGESFGLVLLEGMAAETAVVASDLEGYRLAAGGHATLFAPGDAASLETAIERALANESDATIEDARRYAERWSSEALMEHYDESYDRARQIFSATK